MAPPRNPFSWRGFAVRREPLLVGVAGVDRTRQRMLSLIRRDSKDPEVIDEARRAVQLVRPHDYHGEIQAVWDYMTGLTAAPYRLDPVDAELLQGAAVPSKGRDCDCMVVKSGALFEAIGHPVEVVIAARRKPPPGMAPRYGHTWLRVFCRACRQWHDFDPVLDLLAPGERAQLGQVVPHEVVRRFRVSTLGYTETGSYSDSSALGLRGVEGFSLKKLAKGAVKAATSKVGGALLKNAVRFVPGGQAALTALDVATKGVKVVKAVKAGGAKGLLAAAAPVVLDRLAPGASAVVKAVKAKVPAGALRAVSAAAKPRPKVVAAVMKASSAPQDMPRLAPAARLSPIARAGAHTSQVARTVAPAAVARVAEASGGPAPAVARAVMPPAAEPQEGEAQLVEQEESPEEYASEEEVSPDADPFAQDPDDGAEEG